MMRKTIIVLAASVAMGMAQMSTDALAQTRGSAGVSGSGGGSARGGAAISGSSAVGRAPSAAGTFRNPGVSGTTRYSGSTRYSGGTWRGNWSGRHHRFHRRFVAGTPFVYGAYAAYDSCYQLRHVQTPWGWRWHRVYVCDNPYYYDY